MDSIVIRPATQEDASEFLRIENENFSDPWTYAVFMETLNNPGYINLTAVLSVSASKTDQFAASDEIAGFICLAVVADEGHIDNVSVAKTCRRLGVGERLLKEAMQRAKQRGACDFTLEVRTGNTAARALYEKAGFTCEGIRRNYYGHPTEDAAIYWKYARDH